MEKNLEITNMTPSELIVFQTINQKVEANTISTNELEAMIEHRIEMIKAEAEGTTAFYKSCLELLKKLKEGKLK